MNIVKMVLFIIVVVIVTSLSLQCMDERGMQIDQIQGESPPTILVEQDGKKIVEERHGNKDYVVYYKQGKESVYEEIGRMSLPQYYLFVVNKGVLPPELKQYIAQLLVTKSLACNFESSQKIPYMISSPHGLQTPLRPGIIHSLTFSGNAEKIITGCFDETVRVWDAKTGMLLKTIEGYPASVASVGCNYDGTVIFSRCCDYAHEEGSVWVYTTEMGQLTRGLQDSPEEIDLVVPSPDGTMVFIQLYDPGLSTLLCTRTAVIFDSTMENRLMTMELNVQKAVFSPDSKRLLIIDYDGIGQIWDTEKKSLITSLKGIKPYAEVGVLTAAFSPDTTKILIGYCDHPAQVWDAQTGKLIRTLRPKYKGAANAVGFTPDGKTMLTIVLNTAFLFDVETGTLLGSMEALSGYTQSAVFSPDGITLLMGSTYYDEATYLRTTIFCDAYAWILNNVNCYQAWLIVKAAEAHRGDKPLVIQVGSLEYKHFMSLPEIIQNYLIKWYSISADIQSCITWWAPAFGSSLQDWISNNVPYHPRWLIMNLSNGIRNYLDHLMRWYSLSPSDFCSYDWILNDLNCYQTWLILKATKAHREDKPLVIQSNSLEYKHFLDLPEEIQSYLIKWYSITFNRTLLKPSH